MVCVAQNPELSDDERARYSRHLLMSTFGEAGQRRLKAGRALIVGVGGLGSPAAMYLAAAGVGTIGLVEFDVVDRTNLQRQVLFTDPDVGRPKVEVAAAALRARNPHVRIVTHAEPFSAGNARRLVEAYDVVLDGTDNFPTRYLVNDACVMTGTPNVYGSVAQFDGQAAVFAMPGGPCYRCLHPEPPPPGLIPNCAEAGVLGVLPGLIGVIQATEAIKVLSGTGEPLVGRVLLYDALTMTFRRIVLPRDTACPVCGDAPTIKELVSYDLVCDQGAPEDMTVDQLRQWRADGTPHVLIDVREPSEHAVSRIDGASLIPLATLPGRLDEVPKDGPVVVHCKSGMRSAQAVAFLKSKGYDAHNLVGGMEAWQRTPESS
jgi:adenylyltransferase/sulfurtransferase